MGFSSSPGFRPRAGIVVRVTSKHATPELPLLEGAASELAGLDDVQLLPAAAIDAEGFLVEADFDDDAVAAPTPATAVPASPEDEEDAFSAGASEGSEELADASEVWTASTRAAEDAVAARGCCSEAADSIRVAAGIGAEGGYVAMWCRMYANEQGDFIVQPLADGALDASEVQAQQESGPGSVAKLWCWAQPQQGGTTVVPCTAQMPMPVVYSVDESSEGQTPPQLAAVNVPPRWRDMTKSDRGRFGMRECSAATTLVLGGLPDEMTQEELLEVLDRMELSGLYDFVFLPPLVADAGKPSSAPRVAHVNFSAPEHATNAAELLRGRERFGCRAAAPGGCQVSCPSDMQGLTALTKAFRDSPENAPHLEDELRPQLFVSGWPEPLLPTASDGR
mmetsp:Transcript_94281/g.184868  ORF Transcript_94281/g.184868 Transcript_94281/m.184868 type:complete len:393 (+) Transcript_94281:142-1320(+)